MAAKQLSYSDEARQEQLLAAGVNRSWHASRSF